MLNHYQTPLQKEHRFISYRTGPIPKCRGLERMKVSSISSTEPDGALSPEKAQAFFQVPALSKHHLHTTDRGGCHGHKYNGWEKATPEAFKGHSVGTRGRAQVYQGRHHKLPGKVGLNLPDV